MKQNNTYHKTSHKYIYNDKSLNFQIKYLYKYIKIKIKINYNNFVEKIYH